MVLMLLCVQMPGYAAKKYRYQIAAALMFQDESFFLKEWIEYHKLIGVEHFYLFNNASTDNYLEILEPYLQTGEVELFDYPTVGKDQAEHNGIQCSIYNDALAMTRGVVKWLAIIDADEFIVPIKANSLKDVLKDYEKYGGLYLCYLWFGTSHVEKRASDQLIIETLNHCSAEPTKFGKSIVRPERVKVCLDPHRMFYRSSYDHVTSDYKTFDWTPSTHPDNKIVLHHYYTGDLNHLSTVKFPRRKKWIGIQLEEWIQSLEWMNARVNTTMMRFAPQLRKNMGLD